MAKKMQNLPEGMIPDRDNVVYYDTEKGQFYIIKWVEENRNEIHPSISFIQAVELYDMGIDVTQLKKL